MKSGTANADIIKKKKVMTGIILILRTFASLHILNAAKYITLNIPVKPDLSLPIKYH